jgi:hypothetical protein
MPEAEAKEVYVFCNECKQNVPLEVTEEDIEKAKGGIITILSVHGTPQHAIIVYLDMNLKTRGIEYPAILQVKESDTEGVVSDRPDEEQLYDLGSIISSFGEKEGIAIENFSQITAQIIAGNFLYLIHNNRSIGKVVKDQLDALFTGQKSSVFVISYDEIDTVSGMRPTIFDLQYGSFISKGVDIDTEHFQRIIKEMLNDPNAFSLLKNEYRKLMYSYKKLWGLLSSGARIYTHKKLAYLVSIDQSLLPLLLKMAENDDVEVASRVRPEKEEKKGRKK